MPTHKRELMVYVDKCFLKEDSYPYIRFSVGHNKKRKCIDSTALKEGLMTHGIHVNADKMQVKETLCLGWLMGSHPKAVNAADLELAIKKFRFPEDFTGKPMIEYDVEIRVQAIRISRAEEINWKTATRAAHIHVPVAKNRSLFMRFLKMFNKKNELGFPLGQELWFVPSTTESRIVQTKSRALNVSKMRDQ